jgi:hypothetical protein
MGKPSCHGRKCWTVVREWEAEVSTRCQAAHEPRLTVRGCQRRFATLKCNAISVIAIFSINQRKLNRAPFRIQTPNQEQNKSTTASPSTRYPGVSRTVCRKLPATHLSNTAAASKRK